MSKDDVLEQLDFACKKLADAYKEIKALKLEIQRLELERDNASEFRPYQEFPR